jgi:hypothetical protein
MQNGYIYKNHHSKDYPSLTSSTDLALPRMEEKTKSNNLFIYRSYELDKILKLTVTNK